jgi:hypothetical protein
MQAQQRVTVDFRPVTGCEALGGCETEMWERLIVPGHVPDLSEIETQVRRDCFTTVSSSCPRGHAEMLGGGQRDYLV